MLLDEIGRAREDSAAFGTGHTRPRTRVERVAGGVDGGVDDRSWAAETAVRDWARSDPQVAESVRALDQRIMAVVENAFLELGFDDAGARMRAGTLVYAGIGFVYGRDNLRTPTVDEIQDLLAVLTRM